MYSDDQVSERLSAFCTSLQFRDENTFMHCGRTCALALELGRFCSLNSRELRALVLAATVHDIGKIGIPDRVLLKPGRFEPDEWEVMKTHPEIGCRILSTIQLDGVGNIATAVLHHHECWDGSGYPAGLTGEDIPVLSRIISIADSYDAMATTRPYHRPKAHRAIMKIMLEESVGKYDPNIGDRFAKLIEVSEYRSSAQ